MTEEFKRIIAAIACKQCNGNGYLGARKHVGEGFGIDTVSVECGKGCERCLGSGVQGLPD